MSKFLYSKDYLIKNLVEQINERELIIKELKITIKKLEEDKDKHPNCIKTA